MEKTFYVEIEEVFQKVVTVKANSLDEAINKVEKKYKNEDYILDYNDFKGAKFHEYKDEVLKEKSKKQMER